MKYIRTKDYIHDSKDVVIVNENGTLVVLRGIDKDFVERTHGRTWNTGTNVVIAQADTIEELCDGFIGVHDKEWFRKNCVGTKGINYFQKPFELEYGIYKKDFANLKLKNQNGWEYTAIEWQRDKHNFIFGYIETDKGLIYVAKMNEKGELELL